MNEENELCKMHYKTDKCSMMVCLCKTCDRRTKSIPITERDSIGQGYCSSWNPHGRSNMWCFTNSIKCIEYMDWIKKVMSE